MKAKRNLFVSLVTLMLLLCCSMLFVACNGEDGTGGSNPTHMVAFKVDGRNYDVVLVEEGNIVMLPTDPEKDGYTFDGWYADEACLHGYTASAVSQSIDVYAKFTANVYTITYEADGGTNPNTASTFTVKDKIVLADAQKAGYLFKGWKNGDEYMTSIPKGTTENITLTAVFEKDGYVITYENVDDAYCKNPKAYDVDDETFELNPAYKEGYTFDGWYTNEEFTGEQVTEIPQGSTGDLTLYAKFALIEANIVYLNTKDVQHGYASKYSVEQPVYVADLEKVGYTFLGWFDEYDSKVTVVDFDGFWGANVTLTAKWQLNTYTITYEDLRGADNTDNKTTFTVEDGTITFADLADRGGFTFAGWSFMNGTPVTSYAFDASERHENVVLTAKWDAPDSALAAFTYVVDDKNRITITGVKDKTVTELIVPDYVYAVDLGAFKDCMSLQRLIVPYVGNRSNGEYGSIGYFFGAKSYLNNAFVMPPSLTEVTVTGGYGNDETIKTGAFHNCYYLENVVIQDGVTYMGRSVFYDNIALENITLPFVGDSEKYNQSDSYVYPFSWVFGANTAISDKMMFKDSYAYEWKTYWNNEDGISCIGYIPNSLKTITINNGIIGVRCFDSYTNIENIILGYGVTRIGKRAFADSYKLKIITIPDSVIHIDGTAFSQTPFENNLQADDTGCIYINRVLFRYIGNASEVAIKDGTISISNGAFGYNHTLTSVKCPSSLKNIGDEYGYGNGVFESCNNLTNIELNDGLERIGTEAFYNCTNLSNIDFPDSVEYIGNYAFLNTKWFDELPSGEIYIGKVFFKYNGEMPEDTKITIKDGTISIAASAFSKSNFDDTSLEGYDNLVEVNIPNSVTHIGDAAFRYDHNLKNVTLPKSLTVLGGEAFYGCTSLEKIVIPSGVTALYQRTFSGDVIIEFEENSKLKTIAANAFNTLSPNSMVYLPDSIECVYASGFNTDATLIFPKGTKNFVTRTDGNLYAAGMKFYAGTEEEAEKIIHFPADVYYYSETEPIPNEKGELGDYWHYDEDGNPVEWKNETFNFAYTVIDATVGENYNEHAGKLFDRDITTKWCVSFNSNNYVIFRAEEAITIHGYTFTTANDNADYAGRNPKSWTIYGSNDENCDDTSYEGWTEICSVTGDETMQNVNYAAYTFLIDGNTTAYQYYKIVFTKNGGSNILQLSEISLSYT